MTDESRVIANRRQASIDRDFIRQEIPIGWARQYALLTYGNGTAWPVFGVCGHGEICLVIEVATRTEPSMHWQHPYPQVPIYCDQPGATLHAGIT